MWTGSSQLTGGGLTKIRWNDKSIINAVNVNNVDYVIVGDNVKRALYKVNGYNPELMYQSPPINVGNDSFDPKFFFRPDSTNAVTNQANVIFIPADGCIYSFGYEYPFMPQSAVRQFVYPGYSATLIQPEWGG